METKKMTLANVQGKLSRAEMKNVMAGVGGIGNCKSACWINVTELLGEVDVADCSTANDTKCRETYPNATKSTCGCSAA